MRRQEVQSLMSSQCDDNDDDEDEHSDDSFFSVFLNCGHVLDDMMSDEAAEIGCG